MSITYHGIHWNKQKKLYDRAILVGCLIYLAMFIGLSLAFVENISIETSIIRSTGTLAIIMLHIILLIGPMARLNMRFLPLLYNRRHLGVTMFVMAFIHGAFGIIQFHTLGNVNPIASIFLSNTNYGSLTDFPFQTLGFFALIILFLMAATSHDFWLKQLTPKIWKRLHMFVYVAYGLIIFHVMLGILQEERNPIYYAIVLLGFGLISFAHLAAGMKWRRGRRKMNEAESDGFVHVCNEMDILEDRAKIVEIGDHEVAIFKYEGKLSAVRNQCKHQLGPLGEGRVIDGCITCPWHGYQYDPRNGQSPPPFTEKINTFRIRNIEGKVMVHPEPMAEGTDCEPALCHENSEI